MQEQKFERMKMDYVALARRFGTPLFVYDFDYVKAQYEKIKSEFEGRKSLVCYAVKANSNLSLLRFLAELGAGFDCVSVGEIRKCLLAGAKAYNIIFSGVGKRNDEIEFALQNGILFLNAESFDEVKMVEKIAQKLGVKARMSVRVNPNVDAKTHPYISTGLESEKFGVSVEEARQIYLYMHKSEFLEPVGIHFHIGSQLSDLSPVVEAAGIVAKLFKSLKSANIELKFFDVGGGLGVRYTDENEPDLHQWAQGILAALSGKEANLGEADALSGGNLAKEGFHAPTIICEPGRFLVANAGVLVTSVVGEKRNGKKRFVIVDAAMTELIRPALYEAKHEVCLLSPLGARGEASLCEVVGGVCESADFLDKSAFLPPLCEGDLLGVKSAGAYGFSMSSNYNMRLKPAEVAVVAGEAKLVRKRQEFEDLVRDEIQI